MTRLGIPVPPGFTITTDVCRTYLKEHRYPEGLTEQVHDALRRLEHDTGKAFGSTSSIRCCCRYAAVQPCRCRA
jgi:pyruvate, orthophosphate dikinase